MTIENQAQLDADLTSYQEASDAYRKAIEKAVPEGLNRTNIIRKLHELDILIRMEITINSVGASELEGK